MDYNEAKKQSQCMSKEFKEGVNEICKGIGSNFQPIYTYTYKNKTYSLQELYENNLLYFYTQITKYKRLCITYSD